MEISKRKYLKAKDIIARYEKQENQKTVDVWFTEYRNIIDAEKAMNSVISENNPIVYMYLKSNNTYVISVTKIDRVDPVFTLYNNKI